MAKGKQLSPFSGCSDNVTIYAFLHADFPLRGRHFALCAGGFHERELVFLKLGFIDRRRRRRGLSLLFIIPISLAQCPTSLGHIHSTTSLAVLGLSQAPCVFRGAAVTVTHSMLDMQRPRARGRHESEWNEWRVT